MISPVSNALSLSSFKTSKWGYPAERHIGLELRRKILGSCQYKNAQQRHKNGVKALGGEEQWSGKEKKKAKPQRMPTLSNKQKRSPGKGDRPQKQNQEWGTAEQWTKQPMTSNSAERSSKWKFKNRLYVR